MKKDELERRIRSGDVLPILEAYEQSGSVSRRRWLADALRLALDRADPGSVPAECFARLEQAQVPHDSLQGVRDPVPAHAVYVPLVGSELDSGFCRLMIVTYDPVGFSGADATLEPDARLAFVDALRAASERVPTPPEGGFRFAAVRMRSLDGFRIHGSSLGAAAFVSAHALWSRRALRPGTAVTGCLLDGRLVPVGAMEAKVRTLMGRADVRRLVVPTGDYAHAAAVATELGLGCEVRGVSTLDELLDTCVAPVPLARPHIEKEVADARTEWDEAWQRWRWPAVRERLSRLLFDVPTGRPDLRVRVLTMLGASYRHLGDMAAALDALGEALAVLATEEADAKVGDYDRSFAHRHLALVYKQLFRFEEAEEAALAAITHARSARNVGSIGSGLGTAGLVALAAGDAARALGYFEEALRHNADFDAARVPRSIAYVVLALGRIGDFGAARERYREALSLIDALGASSRTRADEQWLRTYAAEAAHLALRPDEVLEMLDAPCIREAMEQLPLPGLRARRWLGLAEVATGEVDRGLSRLASAPSVHPHTKSEEIRLAAQLGVLHEAEARASRGLLDGDARGRALLALEHLPSGPDAETYFGSRVPVVRALLGESREGEALVDALRALLVATRALE